LRKSQYRLQVVARARQAGAGRYLREAVAHFVSTLAHRGYSDDEVAAALQRFAKV